MRLLAIACLIVKNAGTFVSVDTDSSGGISNAEFASYSGSSTAAGSSFWTFQKYDTNNDQKWNPVEFNNFLSFWGGNCAFSTVNSNSDSHISETEYAQYHENGCAVPSSGYTCDDFFTMFDTSGNSAWSPRCVRPRGVCVPVHVDMHACRHVSMQACKHAGINVHASKLAY